MKKKSNPALFLFLTSSFLVHGCAQAQSSTPKQASFQPVSASLEQNLSWAKLCILQYPEILFLADEHVKQTEEGKAVLQGSYSEQLFGKKFVEFDRTLMTLHCLRLILDGSDEAYEQFTKHQPVEAKLLKPSFQELHDSAKKLLDSHFEGLTEKEMIQAVETALILGDIGKSALAKERFQPYGAKAPDHDDFHEEVIHILQERPELSPSFARLSKGAQKLITQSANLAHYGHITHIEGGPNMFSKLKNRKLDSPLYLDFDTFVHACDVAGALGHINPYSSLVYTEKTHLAMQAAFDACKLLNDPSKTETDAYNQYLSTRARLLGLNPEEKAGRVLTRMGAMLRLFDPEEGAILSKAFKELREETRVLITEQLDTHLGEEFEKTPTYVPALLVNLSKERGLSEAVTKGLPFVCKVLQEHKEHLQRAERNPSIPLNFNPVAGIVKSDPDALEKDFRVESDGSVYVR